MKQTKFSYFIGCCLFSSLFYLSLASRKSSLSSIYKQFQTNDDVLTTFSDCSDIGLQQDQCGFVKSNCHGYNAIYLELYYCSNLWKSISITILISCLLFLFGAISVVASDFFCPNLQTISSKLQLSESMAGVTILAFGNGSPDLFSTFSAMDSNAGSLAIGELIGAAFFIVAIVSGCMGIIQPFQSQKVTFMRDASFLTGAVTIMTWIVYHQRIDWYHSIVLILYYVSYVAVVVLGAYHNKEIKQKVEHTIEETTHLLGVDNRSDYHLGHVIRPTSPTFFSIPRSNSTHHSISSKAYRRPMTPRIGIRTSVFGAIEFQDQVNSIRRANSSLSILPRYRQRSMPPPMCQITQPPIVQHQSSLGKRQRAFTTTDQPPVINIETQDYFTYLSAHQHSTPIPEIRLAPPTNEEDKIPPPEHINVMSRSRGNSSLSLAPPSVLSESHSFFSARQSFESNSFDQLHVPSPISEYSFSSVKHESWHTVLDEMAQVMLPTLGGWKEKSLFSKLSALAATPLVLVFTLTLPVAEIHQMKVDDIEVVDTELHVPDIKVDELDIRQGWNKHVLMVQCIISTIFLFGVFAVNGVIPCSMMGVGVVLGIMLCLCVKTYTVSDEPPTWFWTLSFVGFFVALNWIFLLANEVVGLLQALGDIFSISEAIMGLTVFALGNSIGDLVANTAIAKMGFPTMAISACYAGPLLNMVLGVGVTSLYQTWKTGHEYKLDIAPTIIVSSVGLLVVLLSTLIVVSLNGYHVTKNLGWWMISVYITCLVINLMLEFQII